MGEFGAAVFSFPAMVFTFALVVVVVFWLCVLAGAVEHDTFDGDAGAGTDTFGLGGVPITVALSVLLALAWALSLIGGVLLERVGLPSAVHATAGVGVLAAAVFGAWATTRVVVRPLRHLFAFVDHGPAGSGESGAALLRTRSASSNKPYQLGRRTLIRTDSAGGTHEFVVWLAPRGAGGCRTRSA